MNSDRMRRCSTLLMSARNSTARGGGTRIAYSSPNLETESRYSPRPGPVR